MHFHCCSHQEHIGRFRSLVGGITSSDTIKLSVEDYTAIVAILASTKAFAKCFILNAPTAQMRKDARSDANAQEVLSAFEHPPCTPATVQ